MGRSAGIVRFSSGIGVALALGGGAVGGAVLGCSAGGKSQPLGVVAGASPGPAASPMGAPIGEVAPPVVTSPGNTMPGGFIDGSDVPPEPDPSATGDHSRGLQRRQESCPGGGSTTVSGTVYIPSGKLPLYNAMVYVPDAELQPRTPGVSCNCEVSGSPIASALTDASGRFVIENVPTGKDVPLVVQVGDWRREFKLDTVQACTDNPVPDQTLRLPSRQSEGDLPKIAVVTGLADALECLVRKLGIDASEFTPDGTGSVTLFAGEGGTQRYATLNQGALFPKAESLWGDVASLSRYDVVLMSCDAHHNNVSNKSDQAFQAMYDYLNSGGRVFGSHYQEVWFEHGPKEFPTIATFSNQNDLGTVDGQVVTSFPKGQALGDWLVASGASATAGVVPIVAAQHTIEAENPAVAQRWIASGAPKESVQYISANTPLGASDSAQCGRVVLSDIHLSTGRPGDDLSDVDPAYDFPKGCVTTDFSPQEAVLAFMLFDLSSCVVPDHVAPTPPTILR
jgi:hypothetical protein